MKGNPAVPESPLTSKPTWSNTSGCSTTSAFFSLSVERNGRTHQGLYKGRLIMFTTFANTLTPLFGDYLYVGGGVVTLVVVVLVVLLLLRR